MRKFDIGDLIAIENSDNTQGYAIILNSRKQYGYIELRVLYGEKVINLIYDGKKDTLKLIQSLQ